MQKTTKKRTNPVGKRGRKRSPDDNAAKQKTTAVCPSKKNENKDAGNQKRKKKAQKKQGKNIAATGKTTVDAKADMEATPTNVGSAHFAFSTFQLPPDASELPMPSFPLAESQPSPPSPPDASLLPLPDFSQETEELNFRAVVCQ